MQSPGRLHMAASWVSLPFLTNSPFFLSEPQCPIRTAYHSLFDPQHQNFLSSHPNKQPKPQSIFLLHCRSIGVNPALSPPVPTRSLNCPVGHSCYSTCELQKNSPFLRYSCCNLVDSLPYSSNSPTSRSPPHILVQKQSIFLIVHAGFFFPSK